MDALGFGALCEDRLGQFVPPGAKHRPGRLLGALATMLATGGVPMLLVKRPVELFPRRVSRCGASRG
jgi:hypothetical protein